MYMISMMIKDDRTTVSGSESFVQDWHIIQSADSSTELPYQLNSLIKREAERNAGWNTMEKLGDDMKQMTRRRTRRYWQQWNERYTAHSNDDDDVIPSDDAFWRYAISMCLALHSLVVYVTFFRFLVRSGDAYHPRIRNGSRQNELKTFLRLLLHDPVVDMS